ncbi:hypothetical protein MHY87_10190 [Microvirga sp. ACRRW]|uniref:hypothetical protein n=1 Tax=Microvirga sp. ACRRW TaxID=2918205 RepID=UPI001EF4D8ED|nr:hypothetical protein [Microvirga sp. ACRRW]MCG7393274.1 hypothetical protein [Microvirga sp. ACRRW]
MGLGVALSLTACDYIPRTVAGLQTDASWDALPLRKWLAEDRAEPIALSFCAPPACNPGLAVGVIRLNGKDAQVTEALLKDPERLARALRSPVDRKKPVKTDIAVERFKGAPYPGFAITLSPKDGGKPPAYGAAMGRRSGEGLDVVLAIGVSSELVRQSVQEAAEREFR